MRSRLLLLLALLPASLPAQAVQFRRGDANRDGALDISDAVKTLGVLFLGDPVPGCDDAMDSNDDSAIDITDGIYSLGFLFTGGPAPPAPFPGCGLDPTVDPNGCAAYPGCPVVEECLEQADIDQVVAENVTPQVCIAADAAVVEALNLIVTVCPAAEAAPCGDPQLPGCGARITRAEGTLDVPGRRIVVRIEGSMDDFPILLEDAQMLNDPILCLFDVVFSGDLLIPITAAAQGDRLRLTAIGAADVENVSLDLITSPGICALIATQKDQLIPELEVQLLAATEAILDQLRAAYVGELFCR